MSLLTWWKGKTLLIARPHRLMRRRLAYNVVVMDINSATAPSRTTGKHLRQAGRRLALEAVTVGLQRNLIT